MTLTRSLSLAFAIVFLGFGKVSAAPIPLTFGTTYAGTLTLPGESHTYSFTGTPGQRLYVDTQDADGLQIYWFLYSPGGTILDQRYDDYDGGPYVLIEPGTYTLTFDGNGATTGSYRFRLLDLAQAAPLTLGNVLSDQLSPTLACNIYQFNGTRGQRVNLQSLTSSSTQAQWQLLSPANVVLASSQLYQNLGTLTLPVSGPYCVLVSGYSTSISPLAFQVLVSDVSDGASTTTGFGVARSGTVSANLTNSYTYTAPAGLPVYFDSLDKSGQSLVVDFLDPFGNAVFSIGEVNDAGPYILPRSGTYTLNVRGPGGASGNFNFRLLDLSASPSLPLNTVVSNVLAVPYETEVYQLTGTAGQRLYFDSLASTFANIQALLLAPNGQTPISVNAYYDQGPVTLPFSGAYYLFLQSADSSGPTYTFQLFDVGSQPVAPLNADLTGNLSANTTLIYQLSLTNGQQLYFNGKASTVGGAYWGLYDPKNLFVGSANIGSDFSVTAAPYSGNYVLVFSAGANPAAYSNQVSTFSYATNILVLGTQVTNNITHPGDGLVYTFTATAGQRLYYDALTPVYTSMNVTLVSPTGLNVGSGNANADFGPVTLSQAGAYSLIFNGNIDTIGPIGFQLLDVAAQPILPLNTDLTGSILPNAVQLYQLPGTNGEQLYFNGKGNGVGGAYWGLYDPKDAAVASANMAGDFELPLPYTGNYLVLFSTGANPVTYSNQVNTFSFVTNSLTLGNPATATIVHPGDQVFYTFQGQPGQRVIFDALNSIYVSGTVTLFSPSGLGVFYGNNPTADTGVYTLTESGTYTLVFSGSGDTTGSMNFQLLDVGSQPVLPLNTDLIGNLAPYSSIVYRITGSNGEQLYFNAKGVSNGGGYWGLYDPENNQIASAGLEGDFELSLSHPGTYVLIIGCGRNPVSYTNQVNTFTYTTNALTLGAAVTSSIVNPGDQLYFTFTGTIGQRIYYDARQTNYVSSQATLISPSGVSLFSNNSGADYGPVTLTQSGTYTLILTGSGDATGLVSFNLLDLAAATPATIGSTINDSLTDQTQTRLYGFSGTRGQRLNLTSLSASGNQAYWSVLGLQNQVLGQTANINSSIGTVTLPETGQYVVAVVGAGVAVAPVTYQVNLADVSDASAGTSGFGTVYSGNIASGQTNSFGLTGPAGLPVYFDSQDTSGPNLVVDLIAPDGTAVFTTSEVSDHGPVTLPRSGTYTVSVRSYNGTASGNYSFRMLDLSASPTLPFNSAVSNALNNPYQTDVYQFTSSPGETFLYDALTNDVNFPSVYVELLDPSWQVAGPNGDFANDSRPFPVRYAGTCYFLLANNKSTPAVYDFQLLDIASQPVLPVNSAVTNTLNVYPVISYKYTGTAGQQLYFQGQPANPSGFWTLYDPNSAYVSGAGAGLGGDFEVILPFSGVYTLVISSSSSSPGPETFQVNDYNYFTNAYTLGTSIVDTIHRPGERRVYTFNGTVGQQLIYDALTNDPPSPNTIVAQLLNPQGVGEGPIGGRFSNDRSTFTLQQSGTYSLVFDGNSSSVGTFAFRLLDVAALPSLPINSAVSNLLDLYPMIAYQLAATNGERLYFRSLGSNPSGTWTLYDPNNNYVSSSGTGGDLEVTLAIPGTYTLIIENYSAAAGPETFQVNDFAYFTNSYALGSIVVDSINRPGEQRRYTFLGTVGQRLIYDALTNDPPPPSVITAALLDPQGVDGGQISGRFTFDRGPFTLPRSGLYTLVLDGNVSGTGPVAFRLLDVLQQPALPLNTLLTNTLDVYPLVVYQYSGTAGQRLYLRTQSTNPNGYWALYDPNNSTLAGAGLGSDLEVVLPYTGIYALAISSYSTTPAPVVFEVTPFNYGETFEVNRSPVLTHIPDQITGEATPLTFTAQASDPDNNALTFSVDPGGPPGASIAPGTGVFSWTPPGTGFSYVTNVTVRVTDNGVPSLSAAQTLSIAVVAAPIMITVKKNGSSATVYWRSAVGKHYQLAYKNSLADPSWTNVGGVVAATDFTTSEVDGSIGTEQERFYRVILLDPY